MRVFTWFQKKQLTPAINEIAIPEPLPGNDGEPAPVQKWKEYQFSLSTPVNPDELFPLFQDTGVRLSNIHFELNGGTFSYSQKVIFMRPGKLLIIPSIFFFSVFHLQQHNLLSQ